MRFRNKSGDAVTLDALGIHAAATGATDGSDEFDIDAAAAAGIALQCGDDGRFEPVDEAATVLVGGAVQEYDAWVQAYQADVDPAPVDPAPVDPAPVDPAGVGAAVQDPDISDGGGAGSDPAAVAVAASTPDSTSGDLSTTSDEGN